MELDATQALDIDFGSEEDDNDADVDRKQVANLKVKCYKDINEKVYPVYEGRNIIGRHEKAEIFIPAKALSKRHACIEVISGQHFIFDYGSKNKTRREKMVLRPQVRYELTNNSRLLFADVETEYSFAELSKDSDTTDSMSDASAELMPLIQGSIYGSSPQARVGPKGKANEEKLDPEETSLESNSNGHPVSKDHIKDSCKDRNDRFEEDVLAADSDLDVKQEHCGFETPKTVNSITFVKQTPGSLLKRVYGSSQRNMEGSASAVNESLQDCSDGSFRLAMTEETSVESLVQNSCTRNDSKVNDLLAVACDSESVQSYGMQSNTSQLLIHESGDDDSDYDNLNAHSIDEEHDRSHPVCDVDSKFNRNASRMTSREEVDSSIPKKEHSRNSSMCDAEPGPSGLTIKESEDEETDISDNESDNLHDGKRGFFSPDTLQRVYGLDVTCETDRSDVECLFSPEVVGRVKSEDDENSLDYMLVATQAYGVDYCEDDTELEGSLKFECNENVANVKEEKSVDVHDEPKASSSITSIKKEVVQRPLAGTSKDERDSTTVSNRNISVQSKGVCGVISIDQEPDTLDVNSTSSFGLNLPQEGSWQDSVTLPMDVPAATGEASGAPEPENSGLGDEQECKTVPLSGSNEEEDSLEEKEPKGNWDRKDCVGDNYIEKELIGNGRASSNKNGSGSLGSDREKIEGSDASWKGHDVERSIQEAPTIPLEQESKAIELHDSSVDYDTDKKREDDSIPFSRIQQEAITIPMEDFNSDVDAEKHKVKKSEIMNRVQQDEKTLVLEEYNVEVDTEGKKEEEPVTWNVVGQEEKTLVLEDHSTDVLSRLQQEDSTIPVEDYNIRVEPEESKEVATIPLHRIGQEDKTIALHEDVNSEELLKYECESSETDRGSEGFERSSRSRTEGNSSGSSKKLHKKTKVNSAVTAKEADGKIPQASDNVADCVDGLKTEAGKNTLPGASRLQLPSWIKKCPAVAEPEALEATQAYGVEDSNLKSEAEEVIEETQSDSEGKDEHAQSVFDQPTLLYDYQMETDTAQRSDDQADACDNFATQAYDGSIPQLKKTFVDVDATNVVDDFATQAYGLVEPAPDHVKVDKNYDQCTEECETQAYFLQSKCDSTEKTIVRSDDDSDIEAATQAYGLQDANESKPSSTNNGSLEVNSKPVEQCVFLKPSSHFGPKPNRGKQTSKPRFSARKGRSNEEERLALAVEEHDGPHAPEKRGRRKTFQTTANGEVDNEMEKQLSRTLPVVKDDYHESEEVDFQVGTKWGQAKKKKGRKGSEKCTVVHKLWGGTEEGEQVDPKVGVMKEKDVGEDSPITRNDSKVGENSLKLCGDPAECKAEPSTLRRNSKRKMTSRVDSKKKTPVKHNISIEEGESSVVGDGSNEEVGRVLDESIASSPNANEPEIGLDASNVSASIRRRGKQKTVLSRQQSSFSDSNSGSTENSSLVDAADDGCTGQRKEPDNGRNLQARNSLTPDEGQQKRGRGRNIKGRKVTPVRGGLNLTETSDIEEGLGAGETAKIMFTGLTQKNMEKSFVELGAEIADSVYNATHLITDKVRRTVKFLCCLARGINIVDPSWFDDCRKAKRLTETDAHIVKDKNAEKQYNFNLKNSIEKARSSKLLEGYSVYVTKNVKPDQLQMKDIIQCCGGQPLKKIPKTIDDHVIIISCEEDKAEVKNAVEMGFEIHSAEILLTGILRQEIDLTQYRIQFDLQQPKSRSKRKHSEQESHKTLSTPKRRKR